MLFWLAYLDRAQVDMSHVLGGGLLYAYFYSSVKSATVEEGWLAGVTGRLEDSALESSSPLARRTMPVHRIYHATSNTTFMKLARMT
jgi:hypothetical protein